MTAAITFDTEAHYRELANFTLPANYAMPMLEALDADGRDHSALLLPLDINRSLLEEPGASLSFMQFVQLFLGCYYALERPQLGLELGQRLPVTAHGTMGLAAMSAETLADALAPTETYIHSRLPMLRMTRSRNSRGDMRLQIEPQIPLFMKRREVMELCLSIILRTLRDLCGHIPRHEISISVDWAAPAYASSYNQILEHPTQFDRELICVDVAASLANRRLPMAHAPTHHAALAGLLSDQRRSAMPTTMCQRLASWLNRFQGELPTLEDAAAHFAMSARTLRQRLYDEGSSFRELLMREIHNRATYMLSRTNTPISRIAEELGFSDAANFSRAFKRLQGITPMSYRQAARRQGEVVDANP